MHVLIRSSPDALFTTVETKAENGGICKKMHNALLLATGVMRGEGLQALVTVTIVPPKNDKVVGNTAVITGGVPRNIVLPRITFKYGNDAFSLQTILQVNPVPVREPIVSMKLKVALLDDPFKMRTLPVNNSNAFEVSVMQVGGRQTSATDARQLRESTLTPTDDSTTTGGRLKDVADATEIGGAWEKFKETQLSCSGVT